MAEAKEEALAAAGEEEKEEAASQAPPPDGGFLFLDPYWDDAFASYYDPTLGTCCTID